VENDYALQNNIENNYKCKRKLETITSLGLVGVLIQYTPLKLRPYGAIQMSILLLLLLLS